MTQEYWEQKPDSFKDIVQLVEQYVQGEIVQETKDKQLYYHNLHHGLSVRRRGIQIFQAIQPILAECYTPQELARLESLIGICGLAHDMVQIFELTPPNHPRKRLAGSSETATANKLLRYIQSLNLALINDKLDASWLFSDRDQQIIRDAIIATICIPDPQKSEAQATFSSPSIYQPYLYDSQAKISIVGSIIALADLGALGMDGVEAYIQDGILVFLEDNPHLEELVLSCHPPRDYPNSLGQDTVQELTRVKLLAMSRFIVDLAQARQARFEREIAGFIPQMRQILRNQVFIYLNQDIVNQVRTLVPNQSNTSLSELISFFCSNKIPLI
jgi:hypothetical protein